MAKFMDIVDLVKVLKNVVFLLDSQALILNIEVNLDQVKHSCLPVWKVK